MANKKKSPPEILISLMMIYFDTLSNMINNKKLPLGTTDIINFLIFNFSYLIRICRFDIFVIFTNIWHVRKGSKFNCMNKKNIICICSKKSFTKVINEFLRSEHFDFWTFWTRRFHSGSVCPPKIVPSIYRFNLNKPSGA